MLKITDTIDADTAQLLTEELGHTMTRRQTDIEDLIPNPPTIPTKTASRQRRCDHHGARRPRQDLAARRHPADQRDGRRSGRHHPAHQRLSGTAPLGQKITFIDTPGHAATPRCARAAQGHRHRGAGGRRRRRRDTADVEAIQHAKAAKVPMIVAINKIDKPDAKLRARAHRTAAGTVQVKSIGGDVLDVEVSATSRRPISTSCSKPSGCRPKCSISKPSPTGQPRAP